MSIEAFLTELARLGITLVRDGERIAADVRPDVDITPYLSHIKAHKPTILAALDLRAQIIATITVAPEHFDRAAYDALWRRWHEENAV